MKKFFTVILLLLSLLSAKAQKVQYRVLEVSKGVTMQPSDLSGEIAVTDKMLLGINDMVHFKSGQYIIIENVNNGQWIPTYMAKEEESIKVSQIVKKRNSAFISSVRSLLNPNGPIVPGNRGGVIRGNDEYFSIAGKLLTDITSEQALDNLNRNSQLKLIKHTCGKDIFYPELINDSKDTLYINILCYDIKDDILDVAFSLIEGQDDLLIRLVPFSNLSLQYLILHESRTRRFIVFGSDKEFSNSQLKRELLSGIHSAPDEQVSIVYGKDYREKKR